MRLIRGLTLVSVLLSLATVAQAQTLSAKVSAWRQKNETAIVGQLADAISIRSIAVDPAGLDAQADRLKAHLDQRGFKTDLLAANGSPKVVFGRYDTPGARRTVVFYAHYDGQPVAPRDWRSDPFVPTLRTGLGVDAAEISDWRTGARPLDPEWRLFGRGAADDKAAIVAFLAAFDALKAVGKRPSINIIVFWEGEEEAGSPHLPAILAAHRDRLKADLWLIGDAPVHQSRTPTLYFGVRGVMALDMTLYGPRRPLHSGHYGNWAPNPAARLAQVIAEMRAPDGRVLIPGFSNGAQPPSAAEKAAIDALPPVDADIRGEIGVAAAESEEGLTLSTQRPALNVRGLSAGQVGDQAQGAIPSQAQAAFDIRLVPGQSPDAVRASVETFLTKRGWTLLDGPPSEADRAAHPQLMRLKWSGGYRALRSDMTTPTSRAVIAAANRAAGRPVALLPMMGGSVPLNMFEDALDAPLIGLPIGNHDNNQHAADENLRLANLWDGIGLYAAMMADLSW